MITAIRTKRICNVNSDGGIDTHSPFLPAGEVYVFGGKNECSECCNFMWGKDIKNYLVFRNGYPVELTSDLYDFERRLEIYG